VTGRPADRRPGRPTDHPAVAAGGYDPRRWHRSRSGSGRTPVTGVPERDLEDRAAATLGLPVPELRRRVAELGRAGGPPWAQDQRSAALVAWLALTAADGPA
jgi:hypothetical protein